MKFILATTLLASANAAASKSGADSLNLRKGVGSLKDCANGEVGCKRPAPFCCTFGGDIWKSCTKNWDQCTTPCRGWPPHFNSDCLTCVHEDTCEDVPVWAEGGVCTCDFTQVKVVHGMMDDTHCEELFMPTATYDEFWADQGYKYANYTEGMCSVPYSTYDARTADASGYPEVMHVKRGVDASASATISFESCGGDFSFSAGSAVKGSSVEITGTGDASGTSSGSYTVTADFGSISLVDQTSSLADTMSKDITVLFTNFGTMTATPPALPGTADSKVVISLPVPNVDGTVTGQTSATDQSGNVVWCTKVTMTL